MTSDFFMRALCKKKKKQKKTEPKANQANFNQKKIP